MIFDDLADCLVATPRAWNVYRYALSIEGTTPTGSNSSYCLLAINIGILRIHEVCITSLVEALTTVQRLRISGINAFGIS